MARALRTDLAARGVRLSQAEALELVAKLLGARDWNTLSAAIEAETKAIPPPEPAAPTPPVSSPAMQTRTTFSKALEASLYRAVALAAGKSYTTLEHLLLALTDDPDARSVLEACAADIGWLTGDLRAWLAGVELPPPAADSSPVPTAGFHRVVQRAVIHVQSSGRGEVTGANLLVAIFSERESHACVFLEQQNITSHDAVNFIAHGIRKDGGKPA